MGFIHGLRAAGANCRFDEFDFGRLDDTQLYEHLDGAQITWRYIDEAPVPEDAPGLVAPGPYFKGTMDEGGFVAADGLRYDDTLLLTSEDLWVAERVYNQDGQMVGGNADGIPHKMQRIRPDDHDLKWTLNRDLPDVNLVPRKA